MVYNAENKITLVIVAFINEHDDDDSLT